MTRVLFVAYYFPPLGGIGSVRTASFAHHLAGYGWQATVLAPADGAYFRDETLTPDVDVIRTRSIELSRAGKQLLRAGGTDVQAASVSGARASLKNLARRHLYFPDAQVGWIAPALLEARRRIRPNEFEAIFSTSFPVSAHLIARRLHRRLGIPWVAEYRDPWSAMLPASSPVLVRAQRLEAALAREASALITVSPSWAGMFEQEWGRSVHVIRNGHDGASVARVSLDPRFTLAYLGTYYPSTQDLSALWKAVAKLNAGDRCVDAIRLIGTSHQALLAEIEDAGITELAEPTGFRAHDEALQELARASILIVAGPRDGRAVLKGHVVAKLSEYLATSRPIIYVGSLDSDAAALLTSYPGTHLVDPGDVDAAAEAILAARNESFMRDTSGSRGALLPGSSPTCSRRSRHEGLRPADSLSGDRRGPVPELRASARAMARASIGQGLTTFWSALLGLVTAPILIRNLGAAQYGVFALLSLVSSYLSNLEFGFGHATLRFLSNAHARGDTEEERAVFGNGLLIFTLGALVAGGVTFFGASFIVQHFAHGRRGLHGTFLDAVRVGAPIVGISMLSSFISAALQSRGQYRIIIAAPWIVGTILSVGAIAVVLLGGGLVDVVALQLVVNSLLLITFCVGLIRSPGARLRPRISRKTLMAMAKFSVWLMVAGLAGEVMLQGPPAVLAAYRTTAEVAAFAIPNTILQQLTNVVGASGIGFLPFVSAASADSDHAPVRAIYAANIRMTIIVLAPIVAFIAVFAHPLLATWISSGFAARAGTALRFMMGAALMLGISAAPGDLARGFNRPSLVTGYTMLTAAVTLAISFLAIPAHGAAGAAFAMAVGLAVVTIPFALLAPAWIVELPPGALLRSLTGPIVGLAVVGAVYTAGLAVSSTFVSAIITGAVGTAIYLVATRVILDDRERRVLHSLLRRLTPAVTDAAGNPPGPA